MERPKWVFQALEYVNGQEWYSLHKELPLVLRLAPEKRIIHWEEAEHRYNPFPMEVGDLVLLFQSTKDEANRGFHGIASIANMTGKCMAKGWSKSQNEVNQKNNRITGVDLMYLKKFAKPILPSLTRSLDNANLQKIIGGGRKGLAQGTVFSISDHDWRILSKYFSGKPIPKVTQLATRAGASGRWKAIDPLTKARIEATAIKITKNHYKDYMVESVEKDYLGWDLNATKNEVTLYLEVKGLSGNHLSIELSPNEFKMAQQKRANYRICVVTDTLQRPNLQVFSYSDIKKRWEDDSGKVLRIKKLIGARMSAA